MLEAGRAGRRWSNFACASAVRPRRPKPQGTDGLEAAIDLSVDTAEKEGRHAVDPGKVTRLQAQDPFGPAAAQERADAGA